MVVPMRPNDVSRWGDEERVDTRATYPTLVCGADDVFDVLSGRDRDPGINRCTVNFSATPSEVQRHAPRLGEHTVEILSEAGLSQDEFDALIESGATVQG